MGIIARIREWMDMHLRGRVKDVFGVKAISAAATDSLVKRCAAIYAGDPDWLDADEHIRTVNMAKSVCEETARLVMLGTSITVGGGTERADWLQRQVDAAYPRLREWVERCCAMGTVILKPNGADVDMLRPDQFAVVDETGGQVTGCVFINRKYEQERERWYTRLEYHRFNGDGQYEISNRCFLGHSEKDDGRPVPIEATPWAGLEEDVTVEGLERPLFAVLRMPGGNNVDSRGALGLPIFANALEEMRDLDVAYSRMTEEIYDSKRIALIDDRLMDTPAAGKQTDAVKLPRWARKVSGIGQEEYYQEIDPALHTEERLAGVNGILGQIGFKCGFSNGYFVFNEKTGMATATQVESDDRRTVQLIKDVRDKLEAAMDGLIYAMDKLADGQELAPAGEYEVTYDFGDITYNREEDRARWLSYVLQGMAPAWYFLQRFEGFSEEEAKALAAAGAGAEPPGAGADEE